MNRNEIRVKWNKPGSYDDAIHFRLCVYIHEKDGCIIYVGEANKTFFGGSVRRLDDKMFHLDDKNIQPIQRSPRYQSGYRHWIDFCFKTGSRLFIGEVLCGKLICEKISDNNTEITFHNEDKHEAIVSEVEKHLRYKLEPKLDRYPNTRRESTNQITHLCDVPPFLLRDAQADV